MKKLVLLPFFLIGCATYHNPIPDNYAGPKSIIESSITPLGASKANLFYLHKVNGKTVKNALSETRGASYGKGTYLVPQLAQTVVPSKEMVFSIVGTTEYASIIQSFTGKVYKIKGDINFSPKPGVEYVVKGVLGKEYCSVWIETKETRELVKSKIELHYDSKGKIIKEPI